MPATSSEHEIKSGSDLADNFSLVAGGPIYRFQKAIHMAAPDRSGVKRRALVTILVTWLPLLILSLIQGRAWGNARIPLLLDIATAVRFLISVPLLVIAENIVDPRLNHAVRHLVASGIVDSKLLPRFDAILQRTNRLRDSRIPATIIVLAALVPSIWSQQTELLHTSSWHSLASDGQGALSLAGMWFAFISLPIYRILLFRWAWTLILWTQFLRSVGKIDLNCVATHPDTCCGLGFLADEQRFFGIIAFASSAVWAGAFGNAIAYEGETISSLKFLIITACVLAVVLLVAPLLVLTPRLLKTKRRGIFKYGALGTSYSKAFDEKWITLAEPASEPLLGTADIQSLADLYNSFSVVREMKVILIDKEILIALTLSTVLPMIPLIIAAAPTDLILKAVLKLLL